MKTEIKDINEISQNLEQLNPEDQLPQWAFDLSDREIFSLKIKIPLKVHILPDGKFRIIKIPLSHTVGEVMASIAQAFNELLLPPEPEQPFDQLFCYSRENELVGPISDLSIPIWKVILKHHCRLKLGLKLLLSIKVNSTWMVAPKESMSPREIAELFDLDYTQYTLYLPESTEPLPLETPINLQRGECFVALKDGKYGGKQWI